MDSISWSKNAGHLARGTDEAIMALGVRNRVKKMRGLTSRRSDDNRVKKNVRSRRSPLSFRLDDLDLYYDLDNLDSLLARPKPVPRHKLSRLLEPESCYEDLKIYEDATAQQSSNKPASDIEPEILRRLTPETLASRYTDFDFWDECYGHLDPAAMNNEDFPTGQELYKSIDLSLAALSLPFRYRDRKVLLLLLRILCCHYERLRDSGEGVRDFKPVALTIEDKSGASSVVNSAICSKDLNFVKCVYKAIGSRVTTDWGLHDDDYENYGRNFSDDFICYLSD
ncbi:hypothetical protein CKAH01_17970 [Colletotrichum kahawae]|uniref:Uncharacterized protein n=1 Tax=Colletotrichum kahawae TaxID=34407 RepID=A0AAD9Y8F9_COLKA|nr:hypothetical protein CKAH01_17970 [Colletotrichum kahawae]